MLSEGKWKLLVGGKRSYLYDLEVDPEEKQSQLAQQPELAKRLRTKLEACAAELQPPGINLRPMAKTWEEYYDFYLDGKPAPEPSDAKEKGEGKARKMKKAAEASKFAASSPADLFELRDVNKDGKVSRREFVTPSAK
jgi:uncharacterized sulfatase